VVCARIGVQAQTCLRRGLGGVRSGGVEVRDVTARRAHRLAWATRSTHGFTEIAGSVVFAVCDHGVVS
jgi:hypothetical protein